MVPARLQKDSPQLRQRKRRVVSPAFVWYVPLETMLPLPVCPYKEHWVLGQASFLNRYVRLLPLLAILFTSFRVKRIAQGKLFINY